MGSQRAWGKIEKAAKDLQWERPNMSLAACFEWILRERPELYDEYMEDRPVEKEEPVQKTDNSMTEGEYVKMCKAAGIRPVVRRVRVNTGRRKKKKPSSLGEMYADLMS